MMYRLRITLWVAIFWGLASTSFAQSTVFFPPQSTNPTCNGSFNGRIVFAFQGDSSDFFFSWSGGNLPTNGNPTSGNGVVRQTGLRAGVYSIFILDLTSGSDTTVQVSLANPSPISLDAGNNVNNCLGQPINLTGTTNAAPNSQVVWTYTNVNGPQTLMGLSVTIPAAPSPQSITTNSQVIATLTDPNGCTATDQLQVVVNTPPIVTATPLSQTICTGPVLIALTSSQPGSSFIWTVSQSGATGAASGSGATISQNVRATGPVNGSVTYNIRSLFSGCLGPVVSSVVAVKPKPVASAVPDSSSVCSGIQTNLALSSSLSNSTFAWRAIPTNVSGASNGSGSSITQTLNSGALTGKVVYKVASTANGCVSDSARVVVTVNPSPTLTVSPSDTISVCSGLTGTLTYGSNFPNAEFFWTAGPNSVGGVSGTGASNSQLYSNGSNQVQSVTYSVISRFAGCSSAVKLSKVKVKPLPTASVANAHDTTCSATAIQLNLSSNLSGATFAWTSTASGASGNTNGSGTSITDVLSATGSGLGTVTYQIRAFVQGCPGPVTTKVVFVSPFPNAQVSPSKQTICSGQHAIFSITSTTPGTTFSWTIGSSSITGASAGSGNSINQILNNAGTQTDSVVYTITPTSGTCVGNTIRAVANVKGHSTPTSIPTEPSVCSGSQTNISLNPAGNYSWVVSGTGATGQSNASGTSINQTLTLTQANTDALLRYKITGTINGCPSDTLRLGVRVRAIPAITFSNAANPICPGQNAVIQISVNPPTNSSTSWIATATNVTGSANGNGTNINQTLNLVSGTSGQVIYRATSTRFGCSSSANDTMRVAIPSLAFTVNPSTLSICTGNQAKLKFSSSLAGLTYSWTLIPSSVSGASAGTGDSLQQTLTLTSAVAGFVDYTITPHQGTCTGLPQTVRVDVTPIPAKPLISINGGTSPICEGQSLTLTSDQLFGNQWFKDNLLVPSPEGIARNLIVSQAGFYKVRFTNAQSCSSTSDSVQIQVLPLAQAPVISGDTGFCPGGNAILQSSQSSANQWQINGTDLPGETNSTLTAIAGGIYTVRQTTGTCPATSLPFTVTAFPSPAQPNISGNNFICAGDTGMLASSSAIGYQWILDFGNLSGATSQTLEITQGGNYQVRITDGNGCRSTSNIFNVQGIEANPTPNITGVPNFCPGDSTILTTNNVNPAWSNQWFRDGVLLAGDTMRTLVVKIAGSYTVSLTSPRGCVSYSTATVVTQRIAPEVPTISGLSLICTGGQVTLTSSAATGNVWFLNGSQILGANNQTFQATSAGSYTVMVTNTGGCQATSLSFAVTQTTDIQAVATLTDPTGCGLNDGSIQVSTTGGSGRYRYLWSPISGGIVQGAEDQNAVGAGVYSVFVTDTLSGCSQSIANLTLSNTANFTATTQVIDVTSCTVANGRINLTINGSNGPFTFLWTGPVTAATQNLVNIPSGFYTVQITETTTNCVLILDSIEVSSNAPPKPDITASGPLEFCSGDSIILRTTAVGPYQWARVGQSLTGQNSDSLIVKSSGNYYVRVANPNFPNCFSRSDTLAVTVNPLPANPVISASNTNVCEGISVSLSTTSIDERQWILNGIDLPGATSQFLEVTTAGTYCLRVTNSNGCSRTSSNCKTIVIHPLPPKPVVTGTLGFCPGGNTTLTAAPFDSIPYTYTWLRNNNFVGNSDTSHLKVSLGGWYKIRAVDDVTSCRVYSDSVFVDAFNNPTAPVISGPGSICVGSSGLLISTQAATYQWLRNGQPLPAASNDSLFITQGGNYTVAITDFNGCSAISSDFVVSELPKPTASTISGDTTFCAGSSTLLTASSNGNYEWLFNGVPLLNQNNQTLTATLFGNYQVVVVSGGTGCTDTSAIFTTLQGASNFTLDTTITGTSCVGGQPQSNGSISVDAQGGSGIYGYSWTPTLPPAALQTGLAPGTYSVTVQDQATSCEVSLQNMVITGTPTLVANAVITSDSSCAIENGSITLNPTGGAGNYTFVWTGSTVSGNTRSDLAAGTYSVTVTDVATTCSQTFTDLVVAGPDSIQALAQITQPTSCGGIGLIAVSVQNGSGIFDYVWSGTGTGIVQGQAIQANLTAGNYQVTVTDTVSKCSKTLSDLVLNESMDLNFNLVSANPTTCGGTNGTAAVVLGQSGGIYQWRRLPSGTVFSSDSSVTGLIAGDYRVLVSLGACSDSSDFNLVAPTGLVVTAVVDSASSLGNDGKITLTLPVGVTADSIRWFFAELIGVFSLLENFNDQLVASTLSSNLYQVIVYAGSCTDTLKLFVPTANPQFTFTVQTPSLCGKSDGMITADFCPQPSPFPPEVFYSWFTQNLEPITKLCCNCFIDSLSPGTYIVFAANGENPIQSTYQVIVPEGPLPILTSAIDSASCADTAGSITISSPSDISGYSVSWTKAGDASFTSAANPLTGLSSGTYTAILANGNCKDTITVILPKKTDCTTPTCTLDVSITKTDPSSCGTMDGQAIAVVTGATSPLFAWKRVGDVAILGTDDTLSNIGAGIYRVLVTDGACIDSADIQLNEPIPFTFSSVVDSATCADNDGSITVSVTNASTSVTIQIVKLSDMSVVSNTNSATNLASGGYRIRITDGACRDSGDVQVLKPNCNPVCTLSVSATKTDPSSCSTTDGQAVALVIGATNPLFVWTLSGNTAVLGTDDTLSNLIGGSYQVIATEGLCADTAIITLNSPTGFSLSEEVDSASCDNNDGAITLTVNGTATNLVFTWTKPGTPGFISHSQNLTGLSAGLYHVVAKDGNCGDSLFVTVSKPAFCGTCDLQVTASSNPVTCAGGNNGTAFAFVTSGGVGPFTYQLNNNPPVTLAQFLASFNNLPAGPFTVIVEDQTTLCRDTVNQTIGTLVSMSVSTQLQNPTCTGSDGTIRVTVAGGTAPFTITLGAQTFVTNDGDTTFTGLSGGTYSVTISDAAPCSTSIGNLVLVQPALIGVSFGGITGITCSTNNDGSIVIATLSGATGYTYSIPGITTGQPIVAGGIIDNLPAGPHTITFHGPNACDKDTSFVIPGKTPVNLTIGTPTNTDCGDSTGTVRLQTFAGGNGTPWTYGLYIGTTLFQEGPVPTDSVLRNLPAGDFLLVILDANSCTDTANFTININQTTPAVAISSDKTQICTGDTVTFSVTTIYQIPVQFTWYLNGNLLNVSGSQIQLDTLKDGDAIQVKLTGNTACLDPDSTWSNSIHISVLPANLQAQADIDPVRPNVCIGQFAILKALNTNNLPDVGYRWIINGVVSATDTNATLNFFPGLPINQIQAIVFSRVTSGCITKNRDTSIIQVVKQIESFTASDSLFQISPLPGAVVCPSTPVLFSVKSSLRNKIPFQVQWFRNDTLVTAGVDTFFTFNGLANGAVIKAVAVFDTSLICISTNHGFGFDSTKASAITVLAAGDIRCQPCALLGSVSKFDINCGGAPTGSITATATGGSGTYRYTLLPSGPVNQTNGIFFGLAPGTYSVLIVDSITQCSTTVSNINIIVLHTYNLVVAATNPTPCIAQADGKLEFVSISDGSGDLDKYKFRIRPTDPYSLTRLYTNLPAGSYVMEAIDTISGCISLLNRTLTAPGTFEAFVSVGSGPTCYGQQNGTVQLDSVHNGAGLSYQFSLTGDAGSFTTALLGEALPQGFGAGISNFFIRDAQTGCMDTVSITLSQPDSLKLNAITVIESQCFGPTGQIKLTTFEGGSGPKQVSIKYPGSTIFLPLVVPADSVLSNMAGGDYIFMITDSLACTRQFLLNVPVNAPRVSQINLIKPCRSDSNGIIKLVGANGGTLPYNFKLIDALANDTLANQTDTTFGPLKPSTYNIVMTDGNNCEILYTRALESPDPVIVELVSSQASTCENFDGSVKFKLSGGQPGYRYSYDTLVNVFTPYQSFVGDTLIVKGLSTRASNLYTLRILDQGPGNGCFSDTTFNVPGNSPLRFTFSLKDVKCFGDNSGAVLIDSLNGTGPVKIRVTDLETGALVKEDSILGNLFFNNQFVLGGLPAGQFNFAVVQYGACNASRIQAISISQPTQIEIFAKEYKPSATGFELGGVLLDSVRGSVTPYQVSFDGGSFFSYKPDTLFDHLNPGVYKILVQDAIGCEVSKEVEVTQDQALFIPTLFTPDGDGFNDRFEVRNLPAGSELSVTDRWGKEVFSGKPYANDWDGKDNENGTYFWTLNMPGIGTKSGYVVLNR